MPMKSGRAPHTLQSHHQTTCVIRVMEARGQKTLARARGVTAATDLVRVIGTHAKEIEAGLATGLTGRVSMIVTGRSVSRKGMDGV